MSSAPRKVLSRSGRPVTRALMAKVRQQSLEASRRRLAARIAEHPIAEDDIPDFLHLPADDATEIIQALVDSGHARRQPETVAGQVVWQLATTAAPDAPQEPDQD